MNKNFEWVDLPNPILQGFAITATVSDRDVDIPDFLDTSSPTTFAGCPDWITREAKVISPLDTYLLVNTSKVGPGQRQFIFVPPLTELQVQEPYRTYYDTEPSMFWPKVLLTVQTYKRLFDSVHVTRPRYKEAYQGPTRVRIEEFYSPRPFEIPIYEPMVDRGLNDEIGVRVSSGFQSFWYSVGTLNLESCLHYAINIGVVLDPPVVVTLGNGIQIVYNFAYLNDAATNYTDWPDEVVIDDRQREVTGGFARRRVTALSPAITLVTVPTSTSVLLTSANLGGTFQKRTSNIVEKCGVVYALTANNANPEKDNPLTTTVERVTTTAERTTNNPVAFNFAVTGLSPASNYTFKPYIISTGNIIVYGQETTYTTASLVTLPTSANWTSTGATLGGTLATQSEINVLDTGVCYSLTAVNADPKHNVTGVTTVLTGVTSGEFTVAITGLTIASAYSFKPFALITGGVRIYGPLGTFSTLATAPTVTTPSSALVDVNSAYLGGNVTSSGGAAVTARGVVYKLTSNTAALQIGGAGVTNSPGTGTTGVFDVFVGGLTSDTNYSYAAYATNSVGITYSTVGTFKTLAS